MQFLFGLLFAAGLFLALMASYEFGKKSTKTEHKAEEDFELEEQRERAKRLKKGFDEMMAYNEAKARKG
jgi:hypothetical protein